MAPFLQKRDDDFDDDTYICHSWLSSWSCSRKEEIIKWSIFIAFLGLVTFFFLFAYFHARRRISRGLPPLAYHRWMVRRRIQPSIDLTTRPNAGQAVLATYIQNERGEYVLQPLHSHVPPAYNQNMPPPPVYPGPPGATKVDPNQDGFLGQQQTGTTFTSVGANAGSSSVGESSGYSSIPPPQQAATNPAPVYYIGQTAPTAPGGPTHPQYTQ